jgi:peptide/nickel transport system substrate-binding protein
VGIYVPTYTLALNGMDGLRFDAEGYPIFYDATRTR